VITPNATSLIVCLVLSAVAAGCAPSASSVETPKSIERSITVVGEGEVSVAPDVAEANIGVEVLSPTLKEATAPLFLVLHKCKKWVIIVLNGKGGIETIRRDSNDPL
jgi:hypothetical protein